MRNTWIIAKKEIYELRKNRQLLSMVVLMPLFFSVMFTLSFVGTSFAEDVNETDVPFPIPEGVDVGKYMSMQMIGMSMLLFLIIPIMVPSVMSSYTIVGEKLSKSLEPLLATPASDSEILAGKTLATIIPAVGASWLAMAVFTVIADIMLLPQFGYFVLPNVEWMVTGLIMMPLVAWLSINFSIMVSSRATDVRTSQQISGLLVLPIIILMLAAFFGMIPANVLNLSLLSLGFLLLNIVLFRISRRLFQRESILVKWK